MKNIYLLIICLLHLAVALPLAYFLNVNVDEAAIFYAAETSISATLHNPFIIEKHSPLYFLLLNLWQTINSSIFFARLFSIICSLLAIKLFYKLTEKIFDDLKSKIVTAFFALHPFLIWTSLEINVFALVILFSVLLLKLAFENFFNAEKAPSSPSQIIFVIVGIIGIYVNLYLIFLLAGIFISLLITNRKTLTKSFFIQFLIIFCFGFPLIWLIFSNKIFGEIDIVSPLESVKMIWGYFLSFIFPLEPFSTNDSVWGTSIRLWIIRLGILAVIGLLIKNKFRAIDKKVLFFGIISAVVAVLLVLAQLKFGKEFFLVSHASVLFAPLILLVGLILTNLLPNKVFIGIATIFVFLFPYSIYKLYPEFIKHGDWINVAEYIKTNETENQPIMVFKNIDALALKYHYQGKNNISPNEKFLDWGYEDIANYENAYNQQIAYIISMIPSESDKIWMISRATCYPAEGKTACMPLENFVNSNYIVESEKDFYGEKVRLLRKK